MASGKKMVTLVAAGNESVTHDKKPYHKITDAALQFDGKSPEVKGKLVTEAEEYRGTLSRIIEQVKGQISALRKNQGIENPHNDPPKLSPLTLHDHGDTVKVNKPNF